FTRLNLGRPLAAVAVALLRDLERHALRPNAGTKSLRPSPIRAQVTLEHDKVLCIRFDCDDVTGGKLRQEECGGIADIRAAIDHQTDIVHVTEGTVLQVDEDLLEYIRVRRSHSKVQGVVRMPRVETIRRTACAQALTGPKDEAAPQAELIDQPHL